MIRILMLVTAIAVAAPAQAESVTVRYGDLDLSSQDGRAALDRRIAGAARSVCSVNGSRDLSDMMASRRCYRAAIESTHTQVAALASKQARRAL